VVSRSPPVSDGTCQGDPLESLLQPQELRFLGRRFVLAGSTAAIESGIQVLHNDEWELSFGSCLEKRVVASEKMPGTDTVDI